MTISSLADGCDFSPNYTDYRYEITRLTPHHTACVADAWTIASMFKSTGRQASCNYAIGNDGSIVCVVPEEFRAWTSSSWDNDMRAITFEISDADGDWNISDAAIEAYVKLCVDLIQRYPGLGGSYDWTGDMDGNITLHRWFAATACPGPDLGSDWRQRAIMEEVNRRLEDENMRPADVWEYNYKDSAPDGNMYNTMLSLHRMVKSLTEEVDELAKKVDAISVGGVDVSAIAKAVNDDAASRMKD